MGAPAVEGVGETVGPHEPMATMVMATRTRLIRCVARGACTAASRN